MISRTAIKLKGGTRLLFALNIMFTAAVRNSPVFIHPLDYPRSRPSLKLPRCTNLGLPRHWFTYITSHPPPWVKYR